MTSRTQKILIGIALAIGGLAVVFVGLIVGFIIWLGQPTPLGDSVRLLSPATTGYAELLLDANDPGTVVFLDRLQEAGQQSASRSQEAPPNVFTGGSISEALPIVAAWTMTPEPNADRDLHVGMLSLPVFGRWLTIADGIFGLLAGGGGGEGITPIRYGDERIYDVRIPAFGGAVFLREGTLFVTSDVTIAQTVVDLLAAEVSSTDSRVAGDSSLEPLMNQSDQNAPFHGAVSNGDGGLYRLWETVANGTIPPQVQLDDVEGIHFSGRLTETGGLEARATVVSPSRDWTDVEISALGSSLSSVIEDSFGENDVRVERSGSDLVITAAIPNLAEGLVRMGNESGTQ